MIIAGLDSMGTPADHPTVTGATGTFAAGGNASGGLTAGNAGNSNVFAVDANPIVVVTATPGANNP